jgi:hypothetical protein
MKKLLLSVILLALTASVALAGNLNINYGGGCWSDGTPLAAKTFACTSNTGNMQMTGSFIPTVHKTDWLGMTAILDGHTIEGVNLPDWWQLFNTGACRQASLSVSGDFTGSPQVGCVDPFSGLAAGGIGAYQTTLYPPPFPLNAPPPNRFRLKIAYGLTGEYALPVDGTEYYAFRVTVNNLKTVGTPSCAGCLTPLTMILEEIVSVSLVHGNETITLPAGNNCLTWQGGGPSCGETPALNSTWGQVKSLYR